MNSAIFSLYLKQTRLLNIYFLINTTYSTVHESHNSSHFCYTVICMCCLSKRPWNSLQPESSKLFYSIDHAIARCSQCGAIFVSTRAYWGCLKSFAFSLHSPISQEFSKPFSFPTERSMPRYRFQKSCASEVFLGSEGYYINSMQSVELPKVFVEIWRF